ncbi:DUF397 domain-containing protein [Streptomyces nogalater]
MDVRNGIRASAIKEARWVKSSASQGVGNCVEVADVTGVGVAVRNSRFLTAPPWSSLRRRSRHLWPEPSRGVRPLRRLTARASG